MMFDDEVRRVVPCINPGLSCCNHRLVATGRPADNVTRQQCYCLLWRMNRMKDKYWRSCQDEYKIREGAE